MPHIAERMTLLSRNSCHVMSPDTKIFRPIHQVLQAFFLGVPGFFEGGGQYFKILQ